jgi:hypothetical protein
MNAGFSSVVVLVEFVLAQLVIAPPCLQNKKSVIGSHLITDFVALIVFYRDYPPIRPMYAGPIIMPPITATAKSFRLPSLPVMFKTSPDYLYYMDLMILSAGVVK